MILRKEEEIFKKLLHALLMRFLDFFRNLRKGEGDARKTKEDTTQCMAS